VGAIIKLAKILEAVFKHGSKAYPDKRKPRKGHGNNMEF